MNCYRLTTEEDNVSTRWTVNDLIGLFGQLQEENPAIGEMTVLMSKDSEGNKFLPLLDVAVDGQEVLLYPSAR